MPKKWFATAAACDQLGVCSRTLARMRDRGDLQKGKHWKPKNPSAVRLTYLYNVPEIEFLQENVTTEVPTNPLKGVQGSLTPEIAGAYTLSNPPKKKKPPTKARGSLIKS